MDIRPDLCFVDWLTIREPNRGQFTPVNDGYFVRLDRDGEIVFSTARTLQVDGSGDSSAHLRITHDVAELSFNPSRWNRDDNLFGVCWSGALRAADQVMASVGQCGFSPGQVKRKANGEPVFLGAVVTRVDVCMNVETGSREKLLDYFWHCAGLVLPKRKTRRENGTVYYGNSNKNKKPKVYLKHKEIRQRQLPKSKSPEYVRALAEYCESVGLARLEVRYGRDFLRANGLRSSGSITHDVLISHFSEDVKPMLAEFENLNVDELSNAELGVFLMWSRGFDVRERLKSAMFYRHRKRIKEVTGYDIADNTVTRLKAKPRVITLRQAEPPEWYKMPEESEA